VSPDQLEVLVEQLEEQLPAASYDTVGIGWSADDDGPLVATAYHFDSDDVAEESTDALRELYESGTSVQSRRPFSDYLKVEGDRGLRRRGDLAAGRRCRPHLRQPSTHLTRLAVRQALTL